VASVRPLPPAGAGQGSAAVAAWEIELRGAADPQVVLQASFARGIRLHSFNQSEPTLHEVFMRLVGPEAREVVRR